MSASVSVNTLHLPHPQLRAEDWRSPLVCRLLGGGSYEDGSCDVEASLRRKADLQDVITIAEFSWSGLGEDFAKVIRTYQEAAITEFATLGLACALVTAYTGLELTEVTRRGEKADYWLGDRELMIEISGQKSGSLDSLCNDKAQQLRANPFSKDGYVCVANYAHARARLWFYAAESSKDSADG